MLGHRELQIFIALLLVSIVGCTLSIEVDDDVGQKPPIKVIKKVYTKPPMSRMELKSLIGMTVYEGAPEYYGDMILDERAAQFRSLPVVFSHRTHRTRYTCSACHIELEFSMQKGETGITREDYLDGRYCGACHNGKRAFSTEFACDACHLKIDKSSATAQYPPRTLDPEFEKFPEVSYGDRINWVETIEQKLINPRPSLTAGNPYPSMQLPEHLKQPLYWTTASPRTIVRFPHVEHVQWLDCSSCHPDLFSIKQTGTVEFNKESNLYGQFCGTCHMNVALPMNGCSRCHPRMRDYR